MDSKYLDKLTPEQYNVCFLKGTEPPGTGKYNHHFEPGAYHCAVCDQKLFNSDTKFDSGSGWPAFWDVVSEAVIKKSLDTSHNMVRTELTCSLCGSHLGHVFDVGPEKNRKYYCINSLSLNFKPKA